MKIMIDQHDIWNAFYNARNNRWHPPTSPNTAPATQNDCHDWSSSHMKRYLQCAEQQVASSNITKYCACHAKWLSWLILVTYETLFTMRGTTDGILQHHRILRLPRKLTLETFPKISRKLLKCHFQCGADPSRIRPWSEHETVTPQPASQPRLLFTPTTSISYWKIQHFALRLSFQISPNATKSDTSTSPNAAPATKSDTWTSPNSAPATKSDTWTSPNSANRHSATRLATEVTFHAHHEHFVLKNTTFRAPAIIPNFTEYCACHEKWHFNFTKYCAWHTKWLSWLILVTYETLFTMRGTTDGILQHHRILRLPRKLTLETFPKISRKLLKRHFQCATDPRPFREWSEHETVTPQPASQPRLLFTPTTSISYWKIQHFALRLSFQISPNATKSDTSTSPNAAPATKSDTWTSPNSAPATKSDTWTSPNSAPATKSDTWTPPNSAPATKSHTTLLYSSLVFATILLRIFSYESNLLRISSQTNLISYESLLKRI